MLTTIDNPYNPYVDFDKWYNWDCSHHYYTCQYLARLCDSLLDPDDEDDSGIEYVCRIIVSSDPSGIYALIDKNTKTPIDHYSFVEINNEFKKE